LNISNRAVRVVYDVIRASGSWSGMDIWALGAAVWEPCDCEEGGHWAEGSAISHRVAVNAAAAGLVVTTGRVGLQSPLTVLNIFGRSTTSQNIAHSALVRIRSVELV